MNSEKGEGKFIRNAYVFFEKFSHEFHFKIAIKKEEKERIYALRHEIFCQELQYGLSQNNERKLEHDNYDKHSLHCFIEHKKTGLIAGYLRLITPSEDTATLRRLSLEDYIKGELYTSNLNPDSFSRNEVCEVSRLAISPTFRKNNLAKKKEEKIATTHKLFTTTETKLFSYLVVGLFLATYALVGLTKRRHVYAFMEPQLPRLLSRSGFNFKSISKTIEIYGKRQVFYIDQHRAEKEMHESLIPLYKRIWQELVPQIDSALQETTLQAGTNYSLSSLDKASI